MCGGSNFGILTCICPPYFSSFPPLLEDGQACLWSLATREIFVTGSEAKVVCKTLLILEQNLIKHEPIEEMTLGFWEEQEKEGKAFEMEMG